MWQEKLQDTAASHPWLEPHEAIKRKTQAPGMQLVDWYGFTVPKTKKEMFLKQSARREDLLVVGEVDNIHSFFSDYETEWRSNILFDDLDEALRYCEDVRSGFMKLKYIKGGVIPVQFEDEQSTHNYSPKKLEESLPKVQKARSGSGCRQGKGNRVSSYQDRSYRFKTKEVYERGLPGTHESRN